MGFHEKKMHLVDISGLSILFQAKFGVLHLDTSKGLPLSLENKPLNMSHNVANNLYFEKKRLTLK